MGRACLSPAAARPGLGARAARSQAPANRLPTRPPRRRGEQLDWRGRPAGEIDVWKPTNKADIGLTIRELLKRCSNRQRCTASELFTDIISDKLINRQHIRREECYEANRPFAHYIF